MALVCAYPWWPNGADRRAKRQVYFDGYTLELIALTERCSKLNIDDELHDEGSYTGSQIIDRQSQPLIPTPRFNFLLSSFPDTQSTGPLPYLVTADDNCLQSPPKLSTALSAIELLRRRALANVSNEERGIAEWLNLRLRAIVNWLLYCEPLVKAEFTLPTIRASCWPALGHLFAHQRAVEATCRLATVLGLDVRRLTTDELEKQVLRALDVCLEVLGLRLDTLDPDANRLSYFDVCVGPWILCLMSMPVADHKSGLAELILENKYFSKGSLESYVAQLHTIICEVMRNRGSDMTYLAPGGFEERPDPFGSSFQSPRRQRARQLNSAESEPRFAYLPPMLQRVALKIQERWRCWQQPLLGFAPAWSTTSLMHPIKEGLNGEERPLNDPTYNTTSEKSPKQIAKRFAEQPSVLRSICSWQQLIIPSIVIVSASVVVASVAFNRSRGFRW